MLTKRTRIAWVNVATATLLIAATHSNQIANAQVAEPTQPKDDFFVYLPFVAKPETCPNVSINSYTLVTVQGGYYKGNRLSDENADFRLSVLGYEPVTEPLVRVDYNGAADPNAPNFYNIFKPQRDIAFSATYRRRDWNWNENAPPPYGTPGGINNDWPVSVLDLTATQGESVFIPRRDVPITTAGPYIAMVLFADEDELTVHYGDRDVVDSGYVVYLTNFCVDPSLVSLYRAQLSAGKRATGQLPMLRADQLVGTAKQNFVTIAVRDSGPFLDPRSRKDWWQ
jgi:hypothetical protein